MASYPYDIKLTIASGANAGAYGFMLVTPPGETKQLMIDEVGKPDAARLSTEDIATHQDFSPEHDTPFSQASFKAGVGQIEFDFADDYAYWWGKGVVTHVDGKVYLAPPVAATLTVPTVGASNAAGFRTYITSADVRYDFMWADKYLFRRVTTDSTTNWVLVWTEPNSKPITDFDVFNGIGVIAVPTETDANGVDFYTQADVTAAATWAPTARNHTVFNNTNGRPKFVRGVRGTLFAAVDPSGIYYTVDATQDAWVGPIEATVGSITGPEVGDKTYPFVELFAVNDYLMAFKKSAGYGIDSAQNVAELLWQWKEKPGPSNFKYVTAGGDYLFYVIDPEVYAYDPGTGQQIPLKLTRQPGFSLKNIHGIAADNQYLYVLATVRVPSIRSADSVACLRGTRTGSQWDFEVLWEDQSPTGKAYHRLFASPNGAATRLYWAYTEGSNLKTGVMDIPAEWDESHSGSHVTTGELYTSISMGGFPGFSKRHLWVTLQCERVDATEQVAVAYSTDNGVSFTSLGNTGAGGSGVVRTKLEYSAVNSNSIVLRFTLTGDGSNTPILRVFDHHQRVRFRYLPRVAASVRVANYVELLNGQPDSRTAAQVRADMEKLRSEDGTILYEDYVGNSFNVSVDNIGFRVSRHENPADKGELEGGITVSRADSGA